MDNNTIAAISTPLGPGGIGIIRISGPDAYKILTRLFIRADRNTSQADESLRSHRVYYGHIRDLKNGSILDEVLAIFMKRPKSFTREDVVEIHSHSGYVVLDRLLNTVIDAGAQLGEPGAFIKRAFLNGRIDLSQAEAVIDLINAPCEIALKMANRQLSGELSDAIANIISTLYELRARAEAGIEFPENADVKNDKGTDDDLGILQNGVLNEIRLLIKKEKESAVFRDGMVLTITGVPNVGKSSLLNRLVERETAIVSEMPGTTRDVVREYCSIQGIPVVICDTAGIHHTNDPVETIGIQKAKDCVGGADVVLMVVEATRPLGSYEESLIAEANQKNLIVVINKDDICITSAVSALEKRLEGFRHIRVSAKHGSGIAELKSMIFDGLVSGGSPDNSQRVAPNLRQRKVLERSEVLIVRCLKVAAINPELVADALKDVIVCLEEISGYRDNEALYDDIFNQFCVGK